MDMCMFVEGSRAKRKKCVCEVIILVKHCFQVTFTHLFTCLFHFFEEQSINHHQLINSLLINNTINQNPSIFSINLINIDS